MTPDEVEACFTRSDGSFRFARWNRPLAPVIFGTDDASLTPLKDAIRTTAFIANLDVVETDPELGANFLMFFCQRWAELSDIPNLDRLIPDFAALIDRLGQAGANQYRSFSFDADGAIKLCVILLRYDEALSVVSAQTLATAQTIQSLLLWSDKAFMEKSPIAMVAGQDIAVVAPDIAALTRAAYDKTLPDQTTDPSLALRLAPRVSRLLEPVSR